MASPYVNLALILLFLLSVVHAQNRYFNQESMTTNATENTDKRPPCVLINNYCGKVVPSTGGMKKECCGDLICYKNKCRRRTCC